MSQEYFPPMPKGKSPARAVKHDGDDATNDMLRDPVTPGSGRPGYVTVGSGSTSHHAARLQSLLDRDSGYGGSIAGDEPGSPEILRRTSETKSLPFRSYGTINNESL
ncbi:hypothetical protein ONZ43_g7308 [Nemania bipapillata]|uniref:Uncharacterized protein n=1 Tax=Nemania bipapillata TaxID=110536 RepID=A0ACC2HRM6_9PEZI|nr:hypothetical protein ONZ43_g7308 [Nemania bipapillata]